jgi:hypothetical protein
VQGVVTARAYVADLPDPLPTASTAAVTPASQTGSPSLKAAP